MGKQKSFIIVGTTFLGIILIILFFSLFSGLFVDIKCEFASDQYSINIGQSRHLAPNLYLTSYDEDDVIDFEYTISDTSIATVEKGTYSRGQAEVDAWVFVETDANGRETKKYSKVPAQPEDVVTIDESNNWLINGVKTGYKALENSTVEKNAMQLKDKVDCWILNGTQTSYACAIGGEPTRGENGNWFVNGKDTKITYKGVQVTVNAIKEGITKITGTGKIKNKSYTITADIVVRNAQAAGLSSDYVEDRIYLAVGQDHYVLYEVASTIEGVNVFPVLEIEAENSFRDLVVVDEELQKVTTVKEGTLLIYLYVPNPNKPRDYFSSSFSIVIIDQLVMEQTDEAGEVVSQYSVTFTADMADKLEEMRRKIYALNINENDVNFDIEVLTEEVASINTLYEEIIQLILAEDEQIESSLIEARIQRMVGELYKKVQDATNIIDKSGN